MMEVSKILIGIDNSKYAEHAAAYGFALARKLGAEVGLVNIIEPVPATLNNATDTAFGMPFTGTADMVNVDLVEAQNQVSDGIIQNTIDKFAEGLTVTQFNEYGSSSDGIVNCALQFGAGMIVIGTHHRSGFDRLLMGSVAEDVIRKAGVPVLVVPMPEETA